MNVSDGPPSTVDLLTEVVRAGMVLFPEFGFLAPNGILRLAGQFGGVERVRIEVPPNEFLHLQGVGVEIEGTGPDNGLTVSRLAQVTTSEWYKDYGTRYRPEVFFDIDHPQGTQVHTTNRGEPWVEIAFDHPLDIASLRLRNVSTAMAKRARDIRVLTRANGEWTVRYDATVRASELEKALSRAVTGVSSPTAVRQLLPVAAMTIYGDYATAQKAFDALTLATGDRKHFRTVMSQTVLSDRSLEWTVHGPQRCFRFWSANEKRAYTKKTVHIATALQELSPNVCFGFGAALAVVRNGDVIPHDDDLDLIIGFEPHEASSLEEGLRRVEEFLRPRGFVVRGSFSAHRHVVWQGGKHVDVFVGLFEDDTISWYPGKRGSLTRETMFPTSAGTLHGMTVPLPRNPLVYLETVYGPGWRSPDPNFTHIWDRSGYADLARRPAPPVA